MATIRVINRKKKGTSCVAIVRKKGYRTITKTFSNKTVAGHWAKQVEASMENGSYVESVVATCTKRVKIELVKQLIDFFRDNVAPTAYSDFEKYNSMYDWWINKIGAIKLTVLKASDLNACKQILLTEPIRTGKPRKANTINKFLMCMSAVLTYATNELELIPYNPMSKVSIVPKPSGRKRYLSEEELPRLLEACKNHSDIVYLFTLIALATGGRYSEVLHLKLENIDYKNQRVYFLDTKNNESRGVYLEAKILAFLKQYCIDNNITDYVFRGSRKGQLCYIRGRLYKTSMA